MTTEDIAKNLLEGKTCDHCVGLHSGCVGKECNTCESWVRTSKFKVKWTPAQQQRATLSALKEKYNYYSQ
jgi:hypothetical protein